jgi:hypothetical protein
MLMVNWREDVEFFYFLIMTVSIVMVFFNLYPLWGIPTAAVTTAVVGVIEAIIGFAAFESERAVEKWNKLTKK